MSKRRRGPGEGSIYQRKDGRYVGQYEVEGKRRYVYGRDKSEVRERLTKAFCKGSKAVHYSHLFIYRGLQRVSTAHGLCSLSAYTY